MKFSAGEDLYGEHCCPTPALWWQSTGLAPLDIPVCLSRHLWSPSPKAQGLASWPWKDCPTRFGHSKETWRVSPSLPLQGLTTTCTHKHFFLTRKRTQLRPLKAHERTCKTTHSGVPLSSDHCDLILLRGFVFCFQRRLRFSYERSNCHWKRTLA